MGKNVLPSQTSEMHKYILRLSNRHKLPIDICYVEEDNIFWRKSCFENHLKQENKRVKKEFYAILERRIKLISAHKRKPSFSFFSKTTTFLISPIYKGEKRQILLAFGPFHKNELEKVYGISSTCIIFFGNHLHTYEKEVHAVIESILLHEEFYKYGLKHWARHTRYDSSYLSREFTKFVGCSYSDYREEYRKRYARTLVLQTELPIVEIANQLGYYDQNHFYNAFVKMFGFAPSIYRETFKNF